MSVHRCGWEGCQLRVPPYLWGCRAHWYRLPLELRRELERHFVPGQSVSTWTVGYRSALAAIDRWIAEQTKPAPT